MAQVSADELERWRSMHALNVILALADYAKQDITFEPIKNRMTSRWHATARGREFELLVTGSKFFAPRARKGGGGVIDLAPHLLGVDFKTAVTALRNAGI